MKKNLNSKKKARVCVRGGKYHEGDEDAPDGGLPDAEGDQEQVGADEVIDRRGECEPKDTEIVPVADLDMSVPQNVVPHSLGKETDTREQQGAPDEIESIVGNSPHYYHY